MEPTAEFSDNTLHNLVQISKKLFDAKQTKAEVEMQLSQLTFFRNFTELIKDSENEILQSIFRFTYQVFPDSRDASAGGSGEWIRLTVENVTEELSFDPRYWHFSIGFNRGTQVSVWKLDSSLSPKQSTSFCTPFILSQDFSAVEIEISLIFSFEISETPFLRVFNFSTISLDILHVLSPDSRASPSNESRKLGPPYLLALDSDPITEDLNAIPPLLTFHLKCNESLRKAFIPLILSDSRHRGFPDTLFGNESVFGISFHVGEERIQILEEGESIQMTAFNSKLLIALKIAVFRRLMRLDGLRVICPTDDDCDKLYRVKLSLESSVGNNEDSNPETRDFSELYVSLRSVMEGVQFHLGPLPSTPTRQEEIPAQVDAEHPEPEYSRPVRLPQIVDLND